MADADFSSFKALLEPGRRFVLTTHVQPDGDGLGSQLALYELIRACGSTARIINHDPTPGALDFLDPDRLCETYAPEVHDDPIESADVVIMVDNSVPSRLAAMLAPVERSRAVRACIDHHPDPDPFWTVLVVNERASCTAELVWKLYGRMGRELSEPVASLLYAALLADTGRFRFANTTASAFRMASELVAAGADPAVVHGHLEESMAEGFVRLCGEMLTGMEIRSGGRLVLLRAPKAMLEKYGMVEEDLSEVINTSLRKRGSCLAALFREQQDGQIKVSLRSKGARNVNRLARAHGGGGHRNASGIVLEGALEEVVERLLADLEVLAAD
jgi:bifunctional oligoribonuclease and PAP phosphatase NrnA